MSEILNKQIVLSLNRLWQPLGFRSVKKSFEDVCSINPHTGIPPFMPMDLTFATNEDGTYNTDVLLNARPISVDEWMELPIRSCDLSITCARRDIRVPTIIIASSFDKVPVMLPKFSSAAVWERDKSTCQVTKQPVTRETGDIAHDVARHHGGRRSFDNVAVVRKDLNRLQGTRTFAEMGWRIHPKTPKPVPVFFTIDDIKHESQKHFVGGN